MYIETNLTVLQAFVAAIFLFTGIGLVLSRQNRLSLVRVRSYIRTAKEQRDFEQE